MTANDKIKLGDLFSIRKEPGSPGSTLMSVTINNGLVERGTLDRKTDTGLTPEEHLAIRKGDIAYNMMRMWQGAFGLAEHDGIVSPAYVVLSPKDGIDPKFASYWFKSPRMIHQFWAYSYGLTKDRLRLYSKDFSMIPVVPPPALDRQDWVVKVLSAWDSAIETTERLIAARKKLKRGLIRELIFGVRRFPEFGRPSGKDRIPTGWSKVRLGDIAAIVTGGTPRRDRADYWGGDIPWISTGAIDFNLIRKPTEYVTEAGLQNSSAKVFPTGTLLIAMFGQGATRGKVAILGIEAAFNQACSAIVPTAGDSTEFLFQFLAQHYEQIRNLGQTGTQSNLNANLIKSIPILRPPRPEQEKITKVSTLLDREIAYLKRLVDRLQLQKHGLLSGLMTGDRND